MKKQIRSLVAFCTATFTLAACSDIPMPYELNIDNATGKTLPYSNSSLSSGCSVYTPDDYSIGWSLGSSYAQISGWTNSTANQTESWLISPAINTTTPTGVYFTFDYTIRYGASADIAANHKVLASCDWDGTADNVANATWIELAFTPEASSYSDWTVYPSNSIALPDELLNKPTVYIAWKYKCGSTQATITTWEIKNLVIRTGTGGDKKESNDPSTQNSLPYTSSSLKDGFTVQTIKGTAWSLGSSYAKASGYASGVTTPSESWLIAPAVSTEGTENVKISFNYELHYAASLMDCQKVYVSTDYSGDATAATWTDLGITLENNPGSTWNFTYTAQAQLPAAFVGQPKVYVAFWWKCETSSSTWELKNLSIEEGTVNGDNSGDTSGNTYGLATTPSAGTFLIGANIDGTYKVAESFAASKTYGYLNGSDLTATDGVITNTATTNEWTIKAVSGGYTIQDASGRYLYMTGTYNSFNVDATQPADGAVWTITIASNGEATIKNNTTGKTIQWSTQYSSYGAYSDITNVLPRLFKKGASADASDDSGDSGNGDSGNGDSGDTSAGTKADPYTCANVQSLNNPATKAYVTGYIVGYVNGNSLSAANVKFEAASASETEILLADNTSETDYTKVVPVQLPTGDIRTRLNPAIADNIGKKVIVYGSLERYFGTQGVKSTSWAQIGTETVGVDPEPTE